MKVKRFEIEGNAGLIQEQQQQQQQTNGSPTSTPPTTPTLSSPTNSPSLLSSTLQILAHLDGSSSYVRFDSNI